MQTAPGYLASSMDFGQNAAGVAAVSTSINGNGFKPDGLPYFVRARRAGQQAATIDEWVTLFRDGNNGGYANSWLLAETKQNLVAAYELTLKHEELQEPTDSGACFSCNIPLSTVIRVKSGSGTTTSAAAARGSIHAALAAQRAHRSETAKKIISDHYDPYTRPKPCGRTIASSRQRRRPLAGGSLAHPWGSLTVLTAGLLRATLRSTLGEACGTPFEAFFLRNPHRVDAPSDP
jgi:hypothetical protein